MNGTNNQLSNDINPIPSTSLADSIQEIEKCGCYWGSISSRDAEHLLADKPSGTFLIRDSESPNHIFALSHRTSTKTYHSRIPRHNGYYCLGGPHAMVRSPSLVDLVKKIIECSKNNDRTKILMHPSENTPMAETVSLIEPLDRIQMLPCLKYLCRLKIRQSLNDFRQIQTYFFMQATKSQKWSRNAFKVNSNISNWTCSISKIFCSCSSKQVIFNFIWTTTVNFIRMFQLINESKPCGLIHQKNSGSTK
uniref:SH2 domain-containing protein n=1 Tax=Panagrolaimus sp. PS1159 TaxID=55785 RepID=A0AC35GI31_9BILA